MKRSWFRHWPFHSDVTNKECLKQRMPLRLSTMLKVVAWTLCSQCAVAQPGWWQSASSGYIPTDAIAVGQEPDTFGNPLPLYHCRAPYGGGVQIGKIRPGFHGCNIGYAGKEITVASYEVLVPSWVSASAGSIPPHSPSLGLDLDGKHLYFCRASHGGGIHPGKIKSGFAGCHIGYGGQELELPNYEVLADVDDPVANPGIGLQGGEFVPIEGFLIGGHEADGMPLYLCVGDLGSGNQVAQSPGKYKADWGMNCDITFGGRERLVREPPGGFVKLYGTGIASGTIFFAGYESNGERLAPCLASYNNGVHPGKYSQALGGCHIAYGGKEIAINDRYSNIINSLSAYNY